MSPAHRFFTLLLAAAQVVVGGAFAIADARAEARATAEGVRTHVESESSPSCARQHLADCAVCRALDASAAPLAIDAIDVPAATSPSAPVALEQGDVLGTSPRRPNSRAPPAAAAGALRPRPS